LEGEEQPIHRQYASTIALAGNKEDNFCEFEEVRVPSIDGGGDAAVGWVAHSSYLGAIPKGERIRGIRVRVGNIQVGDEGVFDHLFEEERFNRWCVGEVHLLDSRIIPNGRRDYFERDPHLRNLENHLAPIFGQIAARCRAASSNRNKEKKLMSTIADIEAMYELAASGCLAANNAQAFVEQALQGVANAKQELGSSGIGNRSAETLNTLEDKLRNFDPNGGCFPMSGISSAEVDAYRKVFGAVAAIVPSARSAREIIDTVLKGSDSGFRPA
jgi:molecular chaperone HtpG